MDELFPSKVTAVPAPPVPVTLNVTPLLIVTTQFALAVVTLIPVELFEDSV
jgi:hypothetical protein